MAPCWVVLRPSCQIGPATELGPSEGRGSFQLCYWAARSSSRCTNHTVHAATRTNRHMIYRSKLLGTCMHLLLVDNPDLHLDRCSDSSMAVPEPIRFRSGGLRTLRGPLWGTAALCREGPFRVSTKRFFCCPLLVQYIGCICAAPCPVRRQNHEKFDKK